MADDVNEDSNQLQLTEDEARSKANDSDDESQLATGSFSALTTDRNEEALDEEACDRLSEASDTGWDTDLEIEDEKKVYDATGCETYVNVCKALGIIPASHFVRCLQAEDSSINMKHHYLGPKGTKAISIALMSNTSVTSLDLGNNGLGTEGGVSIADMLKENCYITHLDLSENNIGTAGAFAIAEMLTSNSTITHLCLSGNGFDDKSAEPLSQAIKSSRRVSSLDISHNMLSEAAGIMLGPALAESEILQTLDLSWNSLRLKGALAIAQGLKANQMLKVLNLSYNGFGNEGAIALADALKLNTTLTELDITDNRILTEGAKAFAKVLPNCETLSVLKIGKNAIQISGVIALLDSLKQGSSSVKHLGLDGITVTLELDKIIKAMADDNPGFTVSHAGTGGYKEVKPLPTPIEKLKKYTKENKVKLEDLFTIFDKEKCGELTEEEFRNSLKHISAPLMGYEILKLLQEFGRTMERCSSSREEAPAPPQEGEEPLIVVDYRKILEASANS